MNEAMFHLPGLFEAYEFYKVFLPVYYSNRDYFYEWASIGSIYGAPADCLWSGGRISHAENNTWEVLDLLNEYSISGRLTFSNSLLTEEHLEDNRCNRICEEFNKSSKVKNGVIVHSDLLLSYLMEKYENLYFISSTTKVITDFKLFRKELNRVEFEYVVPDFRFNKQQDKLELLTDIEKNKIEFLVNECCAVTCSERKVCYENVSRKMIGENCEDHICKTKGAEEGYLFSKAMENPEFISVRDIENVYLKNGFSNFKIEGRSLGTALILEFLLYYMVKPECQLKVREKIYLDSYLDLF